MRTTKFAFLAWISLGLPVFSAVEKWTDERLPVKENVVLWLDAGRQNSARSALKLPILTEASPTDYWFDGSGRGARFFQPIPESRPRFRQSPEGYFFQFNGKTDFFVCDRFGLEATALSVFVVARAGANEGNYRALVAFNQSGQNDYTSGLNVDLGAMPSQRNSMLSVEGKGFGGSQDLTRSGAFTLRQFHQVSLMFHPGAPGIQLFMDGKECGGRPRDKVTMTLDNAAIGARFYSNTPERPHAQGFFQGHIAEVLVYDRALSAEERQKVEAYLTAKYANLLKKQEDLSQGDQEETPAPFHFLLPGFEVRELPLKLQNINNLAYRADGKLMALGYNGKIFLLEDTNGDGLEDKASVFWDQATLRAPIGMALTPPHYARGQGAFVAAKGKLALVVDTNRDDRADAEIVVAEGWKELSHGVDALGVAVAPDGSVYFGLGAANFTDAYLIDKATGKANYRLDSERGTIMRVAPDLKSREIVCTGIRFPVGMAFNRAGDLFCSEQEGATWLPNGNPFDELLHIQKGWHYGFPPYHPKHLPDVIDEPSVFDYGPQHQSTCGLHFNEAQAGGAIFGPQPWDGDAIMCGYSRGKIWRTRLVKTEGGYVAQNQLLAVLQSLCVEAVVSPQGALVVATHSGAPDWGSGPNGEGKLYQVRWKNREQPLPMLSWAASPSEVAVAFDRPLEAAWTKDVAARTKLLRGRYVSAGERFENVRPGYQVVFNQMATDRIPVPVLGGSLSPDRRTLYLAHAAKTQAQPMAYTVKAAKAGAGPDKAEGDLDGVIDLSGVEAEWKSTDGKQRWNGWLPHADLNVARAMTRGSAMHEQLFGLLASPGILKLSGQLDLSLMLFPAIQVGARIDYDYPEENVTVRWRGDLANSQVANGGEKKVTWSDGSKWMPFEVEVATGPDRGKLQLDWSTDRDARWRSFPVRRLLVPWARPDVSGDAGGEREVKELTGGNATHGRELFFGEALACGKCHTVRGQGGKVGPDLSNLVQRDYASVLRDIRQPNAALNPDHVAYQVELKDGESVNGVLQVETSQEIQLADVSGKSVKYPKSQVKKMSASSLSLMPEGLLDALKPEDVRDLMTFLLKGK